MMIGVDGCKAGWLAVFWQENKAPINGRLKGPLKSPVVEAKIFPHFAEILALNFTHLAVDMPIGFPETSEPGGRLCDRLARQYLGARQSSLFAVPSRAAIMAPDYRAACAANLKNSNPPRKISKQIFYLFPKMRELDDLLTPALQKQISEVHPELAFTRMNDGRPLDLPKKIKGRPHPEGLNLRRSLLTKAGFPIAQLAPPEGKSFGEDDLLDAAACAWSAARLAQGQALQLPPNPPSDQLGLKMQISA